MSSGDRFTRREALAPDVWLAYDERLGRSVVLKRAAAGEPRAMARLNHPHVITVYEHVGDWAVLEYAPGGSLAGRRMSAAEAARIGAEIADALVYMHGKGLVHCDVKPGNIVLAENGVAKLTDFGSAYHVDPEATITPAAQLSYTPAYAAPELVRGSPVPASDVYSLAATVRALAGADLPELAALLDPNPHNRPSAAEARRLFEGGVAGGPAQLPAGVHGFAGRTAELELLSRIPAPVVVISGTAGVGKTTLAVHWAHRIAGRFPDGQLYVNLRGFDPTGQVMDPADAIRGFLDALGVPPDRIPVDLDAQAALYRSTLSTKRVLIVLDNARDTDQVRPLLPGSSACLAVVTSRNDLLALIREQGAHPLTLDLLSDAEARQLLDHRLGTDRTTAEPQAVEQIIQSCARLPLALAIVAARAALRPDFPLSTVTLTTDDPETDVRTVFSWSYQQLSPEAQRLFRLLGLHPGPDISAAATTSLFGGQPPLAELTRAHLLEEHLPGRYTFHDLLRAYAQEFTDDDRDTAIHRMLDHYLHTADAADHQLDPSRYRECHPLPPACEGVVPEQPADLAQAMAWFSTEHQVLLAVLGLAADAGFPAQAWQLVSLFDLFLRRNGHSQDRASAWQRAVAAGESLDDLGVRALAHRMLGGALRALGRLDDAGSHLRTAFGLSRELGDQSGEAATHLSLAINYDRVGRHDEALSHDQRALELLQAVGDHLSQAMAHNAIGWDNARLGRYDLALASCEQALAIFRAHGDVEGQARTWHSLGYVHFKLEQFGDAIDCYQRSQEIDRRLGHRGFEADGLSDLGDAQAAAGDHDAAQASWRRALAILEELDDPDADTVRAKLERGAPSG